MLTIKKYSIPVTPLGQRDEWEGAVEEFCIEDLQPRSDGPVSDDEMILTGYEGQYEPTHSNG